jgi:hypothetical protein
MSYRTFNHLFLPLMVLSAISAFFIPVQYTNVFRGRVDGVFSPVATPLRAGGDDVGQEDLIIRTGDAAASTNSPCEPEIDRL